MQERLDASVRRQILIEDQAWIGKPVDISGANPRAVQANVRHMALMLMDTAVKDRASRAAAFAEHLIDATMAQHVTQPVACAKGCSHCCTTYVSSTVPEVFNLARAVQGNAGAIMRIVKASARSRAMPQLQREVDRVVCPILEDHACSAYANRPVVCRAVLSTSLDSCLRIFTQGIGEPFKYPDNLGPVRAFMTVMVRGALFLSGLPHQNIELTHALEVALTTTHAEERWLAGEPIFAGVALDRGEQNPSSIMGLVNALANAVRPTL
ncbi:MAG: YkgJ family cysteine cluster protein [Rhodospirillaceae bacterium]|nr:YkgJ family cysteine cluster protein [Rhodospirillaceae bacterium]